ncbi:hypothetical protein R3P38DRAFT_2775524 [Favolaschia claudopus]|uniref:Uncharacterized protein n=1 Tax=Favolaschia claudopus TaxID=2862362 RepID=A0AAW0BSK9_9AGAR
MSILGSIWFTPKRISSPHKRDKQLFRRRYNLDTTECMGDSFNSSCNFTLPSANASPSQEALLSLDQLFTEFTTQTHEGMRVARDTTPGDPTEWAAESTGNSLRFIPQPSSAVQLDPVADTDPSLDPTHAHYTDFCVRFMQTISHERIDLSTFLTSMLMHGYLDEPRLPNLTLPFVAAASAPTTLVNASIAAARKHRSGVEILLPKTISVTLAVNRRIIELGRRAQLVDEELGHPAARCL